MQIEKIAVLVGKKQYEVTVLFKNDLGEVVFEALTHVGTEDEQVALQYVENTFIPDLLANFPDELVEFIPQQEELPVEGEGGEGV